MIKKKTDIKELVKKFKNAQEKKTANIETVLNRKFNDTELNPKRKA